MDGDEKVDALRHYYFDGDGVDSSSAFVKLDDVLEALATPPESAQENNSCECPKHGRWVKADDVDRMVREIDVALNGEKGAAKQAMLCDVTAQVVRDPRLAQPVGEVDEAMVEAIGEAWDSGTWNGEFIGSIAAAKATLTAARLPAQGGIPELHIMCEVRENGITGTTYLPVIRVNPEDDGSFTAVTDYWPPAAATGDGVDDEYVYRLVTHYETMRNGAVSFTPNAHALHCMKVALIATAPAHRQQGDDDER